MNKRTYLVAALAGAFLLSPLAIAQEQQPQQEAQPMPEQQEVPDVTDEQIDAFVQAHINLDEVRQEFTQRLQQAEDQEEAQQLQQEANEAMFAAIEDAGMEVEEYEEVAIAVNADPEVREQVTSRLEDEGFDTGAAR